MKSKNNKNYLNMLRYWKKKLKSPNPVTLNKVFIEIYDENVEFCHGCPHDDLGYCRNDNWETRNPCASFATIKVDKLIEKFLVRERK